MLSEYLKDRELLEAAAEAIDEVSLCEQVSRRHGLELTLDEAEKLRERAEEICVYHLVDLNEDGYCDVCEEPE